MAKLSKVFRDSTLHEIDPGHTHLIYIDGHPFWRKGQSLCDSDRFLRIPERILAVVRTAEICHCGQCDCCRMARFVNRIMSIDDLKAPNGYLAGGHT